MQPHLYVRLRLRGAGSRRRVVVSHRACREVVSDMVRVSSQAGSDTLI
jgi:hypothetical protein